MGNHHKQHYVRRCAMPTCQLQNSNPDKHVVRVEKHLLVDEGLHYQPRPLTFAELFPQSQHTNNTLPHKRLAAS
eukprot:4670164-Karenia_brevis.AAC.1